jgi:hypothetical protein
MAHGKARLPAPHKTGFFLFLSMQPECSDRVVGARLLACASSPRPIGEFPLKQTVTRRRQNPRLWRLFRATDGSQRRYEGKQPLARPFQIGPFLSASGRRRATRPRRLFYSLNGARKSASSFATAFGWVAVLGRKAGGRGPGVHRLLGQYWYREQPDSISVPTATHW